MKKIISILLCAVLVLSFASVAFAIDQTDIMVLTAAPLILSGDPLIMKNPVLAAYKDYTEGAWYVDAFEYCVGKGLMKGTTETTLSPNKNITRGEFITMIYRLAGEPAFMNDNVFADVAEGSYCEKAVAWAHGKGIVSGKTADRFAPGENITREALVTMLFNYVAYDMEQRGENTGLLYPNLALTFADTAKISDWATSAFRWAAAEKIIQGKSGNLADPKGFATRAEAAAILYRNSDEYTAPVSQAAGGWTSYADNAKLDMTKIPEDAKKAFEAATSGIVGASYIPFAYLGSQVVAGRNYKFICAVLTVTANPTSALKEVTVFYGLDGSAKIASVEDLDINELSDGNGTITFPGEGTVGGFNYTDAVGGAVDADITDALKKALDGFTGAGYEVLAVAGTQVVAGVNYLLIVKATRVSANPASAIGVVKLYKGVDGTCEMSVIGNL